MPRLIHMDNIYMQTKGFSIFIDEGTALPRFSANPDYFKKLDFAVSHCNNFRKAITSTI